MSTRQPLTEIAHQGWLPYLKPGSWAIDATAGNGFDTEFLARQVAESGRVFAMDIQECAISATRKRLETANLIERVSLVRADHARIRDSFACGMRGEVDLICFNLGYLPTGDHNITTSRESTVLALHESLLLLNPEGALSVIAYRGHEGALEEADSVEWFFNKLPPPWKCVKHLATGTGGNPGPVWWMASAR
jgi:16S rRNA C1402 N4-methylase RsmH